MKSQPTLDGLLQHLAAAERSELALTFRDIERLALQPLPKQATSSSQTGAAWWHSRGRRAPSSWAPAWEALGWRARVSFANGMVTFQRDASPPRDQGVAASVLADLLPRRKYLVMDLVARAGVDVSGWAESQGRPFYPPQSNPSYCYDWSFGNLEVGYVLCAWHKHLQVDRQWVVYRCDIVKHARDLAQELHALALTDPRRSRLINQLRRAQAMERAVRESHRAGRPLKLIINLGDTREQDELADASSTVSERQLDDQPWWVHRIEDDFVLIVRGHAPEDLYVSAGNDSPPGPLDHLAGDQEERSSGTPAADDEVRLAQIRVRRGQPQFRADLLKAYDRRCAVTGCAIEAVLEAAHIIPHVQGADYRCTNGLLLRADIHTLFDLHLLSIDAAGTVHLARSAQYPPYADLAGTRIRMPDRLRDSPSPTNLASRHARFLAAENERV